jgi:hypothetical protein
MPHYSSPKAALLAHGKIESIGRGRISGPNNAWLDEQVAAGAFTVATMTVKASTGPTPAPPTVERAKASETGIADTRPITRDEHALQAYVGKDDVGMRAVCENCTSSLTYCPCSSPMVRWKNALSVVEFKPRTRPLPVNPWG